MANTPDIDPRLDEPIHHPLARLPGRRKDVRDFLRRPVLAEMRARGIRDFLDEFLGVFEIALLQADPDWQDFMALRAVVPGPETGETIVAFLVSDVRGGSRNGEGGGSERKESCR